MASSSRVFAFLLREYRVALAVFAFALPLLVARSAAAEAAARRRALCALA